MARTVHDAELGELTWDKHLEWWAGRVEVAGRPLELAVRAADELEEALLAARRLVAMLGLREAELRRLAADELIDLHNDLWAEGEPIDAATFFARIALRSLVVQGAEGELYFDDGGLLGGQSVVVTVDERGRVKDLSVAG